MVDVSNESPLGVYRCSHEDGTYKILTPNSLLMGRSHSKVPDDAQLTEHLKKSKHYKLIQQVTKNFWDSQAAEVIPICDQTEVA